jgi:aspartate-semialdehyde dehydrogenase
LKVGVVGATGMVGKSFIEILEADRKFPITGLRPFASDSSIGKKISLRGAQYDVETLKPGCFKDLDLVFFSSGDEISKEWAPQAVQAGAWAVDNSNAFRMDSDVKLVVPEVNGDLLKGKQPEIIANPNCTTIQLVVALKPLMDQFGINDVKIASYQAVSGAGQAGHDELLSQIQNENAPAKTFAHPIRFNCIPQIGSFTDSGFCTEEIKVMNETRKILRHPKLSVSVFTVRVPVLNAHAEAVWVRLDKEATHAEVLSALKRGQGLIILDEPQKSVYPLQIQASGKDPVFVGRIHRDANDPKTWLMWVVADNIRKGAALNGLQIAERIFDIH